MGVDFYRQVAKDAKEGIKAVGHKKTKRIKEEFVPNAPAYSLVCGAKRSADFGGLFLLFLTTLVLPSLAHLASWRFNQNCLEISTI